MKAPDNSDKKKKNKRKHTTLNNLYIPKKFSPHTYNRFIKQFIDVYNYGYLNKDNIKSFKYSTDCLNASWASHNPRSINYIKLKLHSHIIPHLNNQATYFYTLNPRSSIAMFTIDIDPYPTSSYNDCLNAARYIIQHFHPGAYYEPSTSNKGVHIYIFINWDAYVGPSGNRLTGDNINFLMNGSSDAYSILLSHLISSLSFNCKVDKIKGTYPTYKYSKKYNCYMIANRGSLCKLPRPVSSDQFFNLVHSPILPLSGIYDNIVSIKQVIGSSGQWDKCCSDSSVTGPVDPSPISSTSSASNILSTTFSRSLDNEPKTKVKKDNGKNIKNNKCILKIQSNDAPQRTLYSVLLLSQKLGRLPTYDEWNSYYEMNNWNTGTETQRRQQRFEETVQYVSRTFDPTITSKLYTVGEFLEDIQKRITVEELKSVCQELNMRERISYQHLDVGMGYHWLCMLSNQKKGKELTVPQKGMVIMFRVLKQMGLVSRSCNYNQVKAIQRSLLSIGYITLLNPYYNWEADKRYSKARQWGIGENCPKYGDFISFVGSDVVQKVIKQSKQMTV